MTTTKNKTTLDDIIAAQSWDNWEQDAEYDGNGKDGYWDICEVLHCKLEWLKEQLDADNDDDQEHLDTIDYVQDLLGMLDEKKLRKIAK